MPKQSAGILLYRKTAQGLQVFLVHPGGPFFKNKDVGSWSIPKGEYLPDEDPLAAAKREFQEETGQEISGDFIALSPIKQKGGKTVQAWAIEGNIDPEKIKSNTFEIEWPPRSGRKQAFDEIDRAEWFNIPTAKIKINPAQAAFINELEATI
ncbi:NUDIX domain-containing protein [Mucilaginibacter rubeus]|uniref:NUDIX domain-containing protein n=1 Tax=Mucilaginibacter rubeus TaxID=2027860 RepID=A0A5C1HV67_9SPHI|nr:NUDIX domain-containing protein [Mucilaginibacter rubeus]QEM09822.1 NUDIX domain-containing protein [Mucilaginibacter rubeus]